MVIAFISRGWLDVNSCFDDCRLVDCQASGNCISWSNHQDEEDLIFCRLDRVLVNVEWLKVFQASNTCYISSGISDHAIKFSLSYSRDQSLFGSLTTGQPQPRRWNLLFQRSGLRLKEGFIMA